MTLKPRGGGSGKDGKTSKKTVGSSKSDKESLQLVAQEIKFARSLAGNDKKSRDRVLKTLRRWITMCCNNDYEFKEEDFTRIWKGLFYAMWMSDKPLVQEDLSESIAGIMDVFPASRARDSALFFKCSLRSLATEWYGLDQHRMDKFLMLARRLLRAAFRSLKRSDWSEQACEHFGAALGDDDAIFAPKSPAYARNALSLQLHIVECYTEELSKVSSGRLPDRALVQLMSPLARCMAHSTESRLSGAIKRHVLVQLLRHCDAGLKYEEKRRAWQRLGCPEGGVDCMVEVSDDEEQSDKSEDEDSEEAVLDPRAGRVDAVLRPLPVPAALLADMLRPLATQRGVPTDSAARVRTLIAHFEDVSAGQYPLRAREAAMSRDAGVKRGVPRPARAARRLLEFEKRLIAQADELAIRGLSRKHRKRVLSKTRERLSSAADGAPEDGPRPERAALRKRRHSDAGNPSGEWQVEDASQDVKKTANEEKKHKKTGKRKVDSALVDEVPLKKLKNILKQKESYKISKNDDGNKSDDKENKNNDKPIKNGDKNKKPLLKREDTSTNSGKNKEEAKSSGVSKNNAKIKDSESEKTIEKVDNEVKKTKNNIKDRKKVLDSKAIKKSKKVLTNKIDGKLSGKNKFQKDLKKKDGIKTSPKSQVKSKDNHAKISKPKILTKKLSTSASKISSPDKKHFQKKTDVKDNKSALRGKKIENAKNLTEKVKETRKKVTIVLKNNTSQGPMDYYKSVKQSPNVPFDSTKKPSKTNLKPNSTPSPINPFFKKKLRL